MSEHASSRSVAILGSRLPEYQHSLAECPAPHKMQDAMSVFLCGCSDDYVDLDQDGTINAIRSEAIAKMRSLSEAARILMDDNTFKDRVDRDFSDLTMIATQCPGAGGRNDMLIMLTEQLERTQQIWWAAEWEFTNELKKEMKAKWDELHGMRVASERAIDHGEVRRAAKVFGFTVATGGDWVAASAHAYPPISPTKFVDRSRSPPSRACRSWTPRSAPREELCFSDTQNPNPLSDDDTDTQKTLPLRGPSADTADADPTQDN